MRARQRVRRQHTAAKTYLRAFADHSGQVVMHARDGTVEPRNIDTASVIRDFYTFIDNAGHRTDAVEHWFGQEVENDVAEVLRQLPGAQAVHPSWTDLLSSFAVTSLLR